MSDKHCPCCNADLDGGPIPAEINQPYECEGEVRYPYGANARWERQIGIEYLGLYDGTVEYSCPDCGYSWPAGAGRYYYGIPGTAVYNFVLDELWEIIKVDKRFVYMYSGCAIYAIKRDGELFNQFIWLEGGIKQPEGLNVSVCK